MAANRILAANLKSHVGRFFLLRKCSKISAYSDGKTSKKQSWILNREQDLGETVFVLDETNTRVCIITTSGTLCWIQKYYLHRELSEGSQFKIFDTLVEAISSILLVAKDIRSGNVSIKEALKLEQTALSLRKMADKKK